MQLQFQEALLKVIFSVISKKNESASQRRLPTACVLEHQQLEKFYGRVHVLAKFQVTVE